MKNFTDSGANLIERGCCAATRLLTVCLLVSVLGCGKIVGLLPGVKQITASANIRIVGIAIELRLERQNGKITRVEAEEELRSLISSGNDEWGNPLILILQDRDDAVDFLLISTGSDGKLDVGSPEEYFYVERKEVTGDYKADLVYRKGILLRYAHK